MKHYTIDNLRLEVDPTWGIKSWKWELLKFRVVRDGLHEVLATHAFSAHIHYESKHTGIVTDGMLGVEDVPIHLVINVKNPEGKWVELGDRLPPLPYDMSLGDVARVLRHAYRYGSIPISVDVRIDDSLSTSKPR